MGHQATLSSYHTASPNDNPFTVYVITVKKSGAQWHVFRRYREWEDLRVGLCQVAGHAPQMPKKTLFGRMRPEVIEQRVVGLNTFLQSCLATPQLSSTQVMFDFLEREKNAPPEGLDLALGGGLDAASPGTADGSPHGMHQQQLKQLVDAASQAFISVAQEIAPLDEAYLQERAKVYAANGHVSGGLAIGSTLQLRAPPPATASGSPPAAATAAVVTSVQLLLAAPGISAADAALARSTATAVGEARATCFSVKGSPEVLVPVA